MVLLMAVAATVCVLQLAVLGSGARSLRLTTLLLAVGVGFSFCGFASVLVQFGWTRLVSAVTGRPLGQLVTVASYTVDPVIEEVLKLLPLLLLGIWWPGVRRQFGLTDHLLVGAALGVGFEFFEAALRYSSLGFLAVHVPGGYMVAGNLAGSVTVPSLWASLTSWQPAPAAFEELFSTGGDTVQHLVWTALAAAGLGWSVRGRSHLRRLGLLGLLIVCLDHANYNLRAAGAVPALLDVGSEAMSWIGGRLPFVLLVSLVVSVLLDRRVLGRERGRARDLLLTGEPVMVGGGPLLDRALVAAPWSTYPTWRFVLARRAVLFAVGAGHDEPELQAAVAADRARLERADRPAPWRAQGHRFIVGLRAAGVSVRASPTVIVWALSLLPALAYLVAGGFPATVGLQRAMRGQVGLWLLVLSAVAGVVLLLSNLTRSMSALRRVSDPCLHEARVRLQQRILTATGSLGTAVPLLLLAVLTRDPAGRVVENYHALEALGNLLEVAGLALFVLSLFMFPPFALAMTEFGPVLVLTVGSELAAAGVGASVLAGTGIMLSQSADGGSGSESSGGGESSPEVSARQQRIDDLAGDPAHGGQISPASRAEAEVGVGLEESGQVQGLRRSTNEAEEFIDAQGNPWDVKAFHSEHGRFNLTSAMRKISQEMNWSKENIMLDTRNLSPEDLGQLREAVRAATARGELPLRILWWP